MYINEWPFSLAFSPLYLSPSPPSLPFSPLFPLLSRSPFLLSLSLPLPSLSPPLPSSLHPLHNQRFYDKTSNAWDDRDDFVKVTGKYDLVEVDYDAKVHATPLYLLIYTIRRFIWLEDIFEFQRFTPIFVLHSPQFN